MALNQMARLARTFVLITAAAATVSPQSRTSGPLSIARQGYLFAGEKYSGSDPRVMGGQLYAEFQIPSKRTHPWPVVMIHGGSQSGTNFTGTPDGREGWAQFFLRQGYAVYVVDQPGRGRSGQSPASPDSPPNFNPLRSSLNGRPVSRTT